MERALVEREFIVDLIFDVIIVGYCYEMDSSGAVVYV